MGRVQPLKPKALYRTCELEGLDFETTEELDTLDGLLGQPRAVAAMEFGLDIDREGYNVFAFGPDGTGKHSAVRQMLERHARSRPTPPDLCYVHNFEDPQRPRLLELPAGGGQQLCRAMEHVVEELASTLQSALESDEYQLRRRRLDERLEKRQQGLLGELGREAAAAGLALVETPVGILFAPRKDDEILSPDQLRELPEEERRRFEQEAERLKAKLGEVLRRFSRWKREKRAGVRELNREVSRFAIGPLLEEIREHFDGLPAVLAYLDEVERDIVDNAGRLASHREGGASEQLGAALGREPRESSANRYSVNLLVDRQASQGAPVVYEDNPSYPNLVGRVEHVSRGGNLETDFTLIRAGALHRANGGYLLLDALKLLRQPYAWDGLKRALRSKQIKIEALGEALGFVSISSLQPEPAALALKLVLFGERLLYYQLARADSDFGELFKVGADFAEELDWTDANAALYARLIAKLAREKELLPFERAAVARIIERGAREVADSRKLSLYMGRVLDLMREADHHAQREERPTVTAEDVERAIEARTFRSDRLRERVQEEIRRGTLLVDTEGAEIGQINGLSVVQLDDFSFGRPSRITARVRLGKGELVDIEREVELGGPIHSKGVLILAGFLGARFAADRPLSLSASLVFEQSYGGVDGDSASVAELCALLSAVAGVPLAQSLAVTGSVNQQGEVQAIGGVNEKIEGFFDVCAARGLTGEQGVVIPAANVEHLMLRRDVVDAASTGRLRIYPVTTVDEALELLTGLAAGEADAAGRYPKGSFNARVAQRLSALAERAREFSGAPADAGEPAAATPLPA